MRQIDWPLGVLCIILLTGTGCSKDQTSDLIGGRNGAKASADRLKEYISKSFSVKSTRDKKALLDLLTGKARLRLEAWSDDQFEKAFLGASREFLKLEFKEIKDVTPRETAITYEVSYRQKGASSETMVTHRRISTLVLDSNVWRISDVKNLKELVSFQDEMTLP